MIISNPGFGVIGAGAASSGTPAPATPQFYRPAEERGIWQRSYDGTERTSKWTFSGNLTRSSYDVFFSGPDAWEVRYPLSEPANPLRYGFSTRFSVSLNDDSDTALEGKDLAEVRLVISDDMVPPDYQVPPATPDKPHLVLGWVARYQDNKLLILPLDSTETPSDRFAALSGYLRNAQLHFGLSLSPGGQRQYFMYESSNNGVPLQPIRTGVSTPVNTLCIRSMTPAKETHFSYLEVVAPHEVFSHRLTPEDDGATFYFPWGYDWNSGLILPDTELPPGFSVTSLAGTVVYPSILLENNNVTFITVRGESTSGNKTGSGKQLITHVGNKIWNIS
ncbi:hypothetical protein QD128_000115 [Salmonella enterica]|nr:hypothetical protein [Salmonella enterica]EKT2494252.1 hypothetical protein [Salmonella enterica]EKT2657913.1 hypothetical protein [Salmonella enterica]EKT2685299.1 hypothetical protein [Salmonella enterica]